MCDTCGCVGMTTIAAHEAMLARVLVDGLRQLEGVHVWCGPGDPQTGVVSFTMDRADVALAATMLDEAFGIAVRGGLHCASAAHRALGTFPAGTVRASFGQFNTREHAEALVVAIREITRVDRGVCQIQRGMGTTVRHATNG